MTYRQLTELDHVHAAPEDGLDVWDVALSGRLDALLRLRCRQRVQDLSGRSQERALELHRTTQVSDRAASETRGRRAHKRQHLGRLLLDDLRELLVVDHEVSEVDLDDVLAGEERGAQPVPGSRRASERSALGPGPARASDDDTESTSRP